MEYSIENIVHAVQYGDLKYLKDSIENQKVSPNVADKDGCSLLHWAVINNRLAVVRYLISKGASINAIGGSLLETPLHWACRNNDLTYMVRFLVKEAFADITVKSASGLDPLFIACQNQCTRIVFLLLQYGADPNTLNKDLETPFLWLIKNRMSSSLDIQRLLIRSGADVTATDREMNNFLHIATLMGSSRVNLYAICTAYERAPREIPNAVNAEGLTPWKLAMKQRDPVMMQFIFDLYMHTRYPSVIPVIASALLIVAFFYLLDQFSFYFFMVAFPLAILIWDKISQSSLRHLDSRQSTGFAWGIILSIGGAFFYYVRNLVSAKWTIIGPGLLIAIGITLFISSIKSPLHLPRVNSVKARPRIEKGVIVCGICEGLERKPNDNQSSISSSSMESSYLRDEENNMIRERVRTERINRTDDHDDNIHDIPSMEKERLLSAFSASRVDNSSDSDNDNDIDNGQEPDWDQVTPVRLCTTCFVDRNKATTHCIQCDMCVVALDHHCPWVNNCVGPGNRRIFIIFTLVAALGCFVFVMLSLYVEHHFYCPDAVGWFFNVPAVQYCMIFKLPSLALVTYAALACVMWIGGIGINQLSLISHATTTYELIKDIDTRPLVFDCTEVGCTRIANFWSTGKYLVYSDISGKKRKSDDRTPLLLNEGAPAVVDSQV